MPSWDLPELECPFPSAVNPHAAEVHACTIEWVRRFGFAADAESFEHIRATNIGWLAARFHPEAPHEALQLVSDWYIWMFFRDDQRDGTPLGRDPHWLALTNQRYLDVLNGQAPTASADPLAGAMWDLRSRLAAAVRSEVWLRRFSRVVREHFDATVWEADNRLLGHMPDLDTYVRMRPITGGLYVDAALVEVADRTRLPSDIQQHPVVQRLVQASNNVVCWVNDIVSLEKELEHGDVHNLVLILQQQEQLPLPEALRRAVEMHNDEIRAFIEYRSLLPVVPPPVSCNLEQFVATLQARIRGNIDWSLASPRYRSAYAAPIIAGPRRASP